MVRARDEGDLERLCELPSMTGYKADITETQRADYRWRIPRVHRADWNKAVVALSDEIDYANFKDAVKAKHPDGNKRALIYMRVWSALLGIQIPEPWYGDDDPPPLNLGLPDDDPFNPNADDGVPNEDCGCQMPGDCYGACLR